MCVDILVCFGFIGCFDYPSFHDDIFHYFYTSFLFLSVAADKLFCQRGAVKRLWWFVGRFHQFPLTDSAARMLHSGVTAGKIAPAAFQTAKREENRLTASSAPASVFNSVPSSVDNF